MNLPKIISGGQTGVDRAALDAALERGLHCGGWCPRGRLAEDGRIPDRYPLLETDSDAYPVRTRQNVLDSDATVIIYFAELSGGTALTRDCCEQEGKPCLLIDARTIDPARAGSDVAEFATVHRARALNFAGPRASGEPDAYAASRLIVDSFLDLVTSRA